MRESKKLQDIFVDKKIPRSKRSLALVIADDVQILWVAGVVSSEAGRLSDDTRVAVRLSVAVL